MAMKWFLLFLFAVCTADSGEKSSTPRVPSCETMVEIMACPMNFRPVCGSDGNTYANECGLCVQRVKTKQNILIVKDNGC